MSGTVAKLLGVIGKSQPAQGKLAPRHPVVHVGRLVGERETFTGTLLISVRRVHDTLLLLSKSFFVQVRLTGFPVLRTFPHANSTIMARDGSCGTQRT
jgi:hypothetical protein